jgi:hypothetical protein
MGIRDGTGYPAIVQTILEGKLVRSVVHPLIVWPSNVFDLSRVSSMTCLLFCVARVGPNLRCEDVAS